MAFFWPPLPAAAAVAAVGSAWIMGAPLLGSVAAERSPTCPRRASVPPPALLATLPGRDPGLPGADRFSPHVLPLTPPRPPAPPYPSPHHNNQTTGIMDHEEARRKGLGGKVLGFFY